MMNVAPGAVDAAVAATGDDANGNAPPGGRNGGAANANNNRNGSRNGGGRNNNNQQFEGVDDPYLRGHRFVIQSTDTRNTNVRCIEALLAHCCAHATMTRYANVLRDAFDQGELNDPPVLTQPDATDALAVIEWREDRRIRSQRIEAYEGFRAYLYQLLFRLQLKHMRHLEIR